MDESQTGNPYRVAVEGTNFRIRTSRADTLVHCLGRPFVVSLVCGCLSGVDVDALTGG